MVVRDLIISLLELFSGDFLGFWKTLAFHIISVPFDSFGLLVLATSGYIALQKDEGKRCMADPECSEFIEPLRKNIVAACIYVCCNLGVKFLLLIFFMFVCGGMQMFDEDLEERSRYQNTFNRR